MQLPARFNKPEYLFRPSQLVQRSRQGRSRRGFQELPLPWGGRIRVHSNDLIGGSIARMGVYDLCVTEALWRLLDPGELAVDVGANIGYMTSVMARRVGDAGRVVALEPHPEIYDELVANVSLFRSSTDGAVDALPIALSSKAGTGHLTVRAAFSTNRGGATLSNPLPAATASSYSVEMRCLDEVIEPGQFIALLKLGVEGHELDVLMGGEQHLRMHGIRDIVFEEHAHPPTAVTTRLESSGYTVFRLAKGLFGPLVGPPTELITAPFDAPNYLATIDPERALERLAKRFWSVLASRDHP
jgi:FkbM family methyltransferase